MKIELRVRLSADEYAKLEKRAEEDGETIANIVRECLGFAHVDRGGQRPGSGRKRLSQPSEQPRQ